MNKLAPFAALALASLLAPEATAKCKMQSLASDLVTHPQDSIPSGGGVLVEWKETDDDVQATKGADPAMHGYRFRERRRAIKTNAVTLAPGLVVYRPDLPAGHKHTLTLVDETAKRLGNFAYGTATPAALAAPVVSKVTHEKKKHSYRGSLITVEVELGGPPPAGAYGMIALDASGHPLTWGRVDDPNATSLEIFHNAYHCNVIPPGMTEPQVGDEITLVWVDRFGLTSPATEKIKVEAK